MKNDKDMILARALGLADEAFVAEALPKKEVKKPSVVFFKKTLIAAACIACAAMMAMASLRQGPNYDYSMFDTEANETFIEGETTAEDQKTIDDYIDSEYYPTMLALQNAQMGNSVGSSGMVLDSVSGAKPPDKYVEVTDNQVEGVIESDIFKRTEEYIFYTAITKRSDGKPGLNIYAYSIDKLSSKLLSSYSVVIPNNVVYDLEVSEFGTPNILISEDGKTLTLLTYVYGSPMDKSDKTLKSISQTYVFSFDISNPGSIKLKKHIVISGAFLTARKTDGTIMIFSTRSTLSQNFERSENFLPYIDRGEGYEFLSQDDIIIPDVLVERAFTQITMIDEQTLDVKGSKAYYGYLGMPYVTENMVFLPYSYRKNVEDSSEKRVKTDILVLLYGESYLNKYSKFTVSGKVKDQYSLDCHEGILRVVTSTGIGAGDIFTIDNQERSEANANIYCIDLNEFKIVGRVIGFAPEGETVEAVRFEDDKAYVCTAEVVTLIDPVFFFDLSDPANITYTDTGVIEGYSTSLIELSGGYLLGVGYGESKMDLKIEVYEEKDGKVVSVCSFIQKECSFSENYKSYYIDRENGYFGLAISNYGEKALDKYLLLHFDGEKLELAVDANLSESVAVSLTRAFIDDGFIYVVSKDTTKQPETKDYFTFRQIIP